MKTTLNDIAEAASKAQANGAHWQRTAGELFNEPARAVLVAAIAWSRHVGTVSEGSESYSRASHALLDAVEAYTALG